MGCKELPGRLRKICEGTAIKSDGTPFTEQERNAILKRRARTVAGKPTKPSRRPKQKSQIGTLLKEIIHRETGADIPCSDCKRDIEALNSKTTHQARKEAGELAGKIVQRGAKLAQKWHQRAAAKYAPELVKQIVLGWIEEACSRQDILTPAPKLIGHVPRWLATRFLKASPGCSGGKNTDRGVPIYSTKGPEIVDNFLKSHTLVWEYGITTVAWRIDQLKSTLQSVEQAGWKSPTLYVDGNEQSTFAWYQGEKVFRRKNIKPLQHWFLTLTELYARNPEADRYAIFQDDVRFVKNLRSYLDWCEYPEHGYLNLFSFYENEPLVQRHRKVGWLKSNQLGQGGLALVFSHEAVVTLLGQGYLYRRMLSYGQKYPGRQHKCLDGAVVEAMRTAGWSEWIHAPSLVQHTGHKSSMGNTPHPPAKTFPGEHFDACSWIK